MQELNHGYKATTLFSKALTLFLSVLKAVSHIYLFMFGLEFLMPIVNPLRGVVSTSGQVLYLFTFLCPASSMTKDLATSFEKVCCPFFSEHLARC